MPPPQCRRHCPWPSLVLMLSLLAIGCAEQRPAATDRETQSTLDDILPLTAANLRGHKMLYDEGWFIVTSSRNALTYAKNTSVFSSAEAIRLLSEHVAHRTTNYTGGLSSDARHAVGTGKALAEGGTGLTGQILRGTGSLAKTEAAYARTTFVNAWDTFIQGNLSLRNRTEQDRQNLMALPDETFASLREDFSNLWELTQAMHEKVAGKIEVSWDAAFQQASREFRTEYERSGEQPNTLLAMGPILRGYLKAFYHGAAVPSSKALVRTTATGAAYATGGVFLPIATTSVVTGRTVQATGMAFFYTGKTGVTLISPTIESGLLTGLATLSLGAVPLTYVGGGTLGVINQVAFTVSPPVVATGEGLAMSTVDTGKYVAYLAYDGLTSATKVTINQASSGLVLGYNALSALPAHLFMGMADTVILLAWEGPQLVITKVTGKLKVRPSDAGPAGEASAGDVPVGTVLDLNKLNQVDGIQVEVISRDPALIREIIPRVACDAKQKDGDCEQP